MEKPVKLPDPEMIAVFRKKLANKKWIHTKVCVVHDEKNTEHSILIKQWSSNDKGKKLDIIPTSVIYLGQDQIEMIVDSFLSIADYFDTL